MAKNDIITRSNGEGKIYTTDPNAEVKTYSMPIIEMLKQHYPYLYDSIIDENFNINEDEQCMLFKEIVHIDKVVGFSTYIGSDVNDQQTIVLQHIYVLPEYRGNNLLIKDIYDTISLGKYVSIELPTHFVVESLINAGLACIFDERFVISKVPFSVPIHNFSEEEKQHLREQYHIPDPTSISRESSIYDLKYSAVVCPPFDGSTRAFNPLDLTTRAVEDGYISEVQPIDDKYFNTTKVRSEDGEEHTDKYFKRLQKTMQDHNQEIHDFLNEE
ncbi:hypothetical protein [uncultured Methanosphaera sp.]|uniref:hypothetical protein n=1 Tax=uncultured Methanosphaera sp. TaxID=262501 RepID=UPI002804C188|nr:hypothetical protein [uncultured Methanosphaera sp.]